MRLLLVAFIVIVFSPTPSISDVFFSEDFESGGLLSPTSSDGSAWGASNAGTADGDSVGVSDGLSRSGNYSLRFFFHGAPTGDAWSEQRFVLGGDGRTDFYLSFWAYFPSNYTIRDADGTDNTKIAMTWADQYSGEGRFNTEIDTASGDISIRQWRQAPFPYTNAQCSDDGGTLTWGPSNDAWSTSDDGFNLYDTLGEWTHWVFHFRLDDGDTVESLRELWIDGVQVISVEESVIGAPCSPNYIKNGYLMGWSNSGFDEDTTVYIDDVIMATEYSDVASTPTPSITGIPTIIGVTIRQ